MTLKEAAEKFVDLTIWIRELSSPQLTDIEDAEAYRKKLLLNFRRIGEIAQINAGLMNDHLTPLLDSTHLLTEEEVQVLQGLENKLLDPYTNDALDIPFLYLVALRLLEDAERKQDTALLIRSLDDYVMVAFAMLNIVRRIDPICDSAHNCRVKGIQAANRLFGYLPADKLRTLPEGYIREAVLINSRYATALETNPLKEDENTSRGFLIPPLRRALSLVDDPVYRNLAPDYDWIHHEFRTLQYATDLTMYHNQNRLNRDELAEVNEYAKRLLHVWETEQEHLHGKSTTETVLLSVLRCAYLAGELSASAFRKELRRLARQARGTVFNADEVGLHTSVPIEYVLTLDPGNLTKSKAETVNRFYRYLTRYLYRMPKYGNFSNLLTELTVLLEHFVETENGIDFEKMCLDLMAAVHPPTYIHSLSVADLTVCLARHLYRKHPEMFANTPGYPDLEAIEEHVWHAAACHDIGKLFIVETIITYGRKLYDREFDWIKSHPEAGAGLLAQYEQTGRYAHVVRGHHRWYNGKGGYPEGYHPEEEPDRITVDLVSCADCLDAATDSVGRSYKQGKSLDDFMVELKEGSGTRYAPFLLELFGDETVYRELETILNTGRDDKYRHTYGILENVMR